MLKKFIAGIATSTALVAILFVSVSPAEAADPPSCSGFFSVDQSMPSGLMSCVVPAGISSLKVDATGGGGGYGYGGSSGSSNGGQGANVVTTISVTPGETLNLEVGQGGISTGSYRGGGGGGWTAVLRGTTLLVVAAGGGGGGAVSNTSATGFFAGGNGGNTTGGDGSPATFGSVTSCSGFGATVSAGGARCTQAAYQGGAGSSETGGYGNEQSHGERAPGASRWQAGSYGGYNGAGASGGAGYFGGSGGGSTQDPDSTYVFGGSGGGGSSFIAAGSATYGLGDNRGMRNASNTQSAGDGLLQLYSAPLAPTISTIAAGNASATVNFDAPLANGGGIIRNYEYSTNGGDSWTALNPTSTSSPFSISGLTNGVTYDVHIRAVNVYGSGVASNPLSVTPVAPSLDPITPGSNPNLPADGVPLGQSVFLVNGELQSVTVEPNASSNPSGLSVIGTGFTMGLTGMNGKGEPLGLTPDGALILEDDRTALVEGTGFKANSEVEVYLFSTPRLLGTVPTNSSGSFSGSVSIPLNISSGRHTLQSNGYSPTGEVRSLSLGVKLNAKSELAETGTQPDSKIVVGLLILLGGGLAITGSVGMKNASRRRANPQRQ